MPDVEGTHAAAAIPLALFYRTPGPMQENPEGRRHHPAGEFQSRDMAVSRLKPVL